MSEFVCLKGICSNKLELRKGLRVSQKGGGEKEGKGKKKGEGAFEYYGISLLSP